MTHADSRSIHRTRCRHLAWAALGVIGVHLALLSPPVAHLTGLSVKASQGSARPVRTPAVPDLAGTSSGSPALRLDWAVQHSAANDPSPSVSSGSLSSTPEPLDTQTWEMAQSSTTPIPASEQSPSSGPTIAKETQPFKPPAAGKLQFDVLGKIKGFGYTVSGELVWSQDGRRYQSRFEIGMPLLGSRVQTSQGEITPQGLAPIRFGDKVRSEQAAHFDRDKGLISFSANTPSIPLEAGAQDRLSLFMQLAAQLAGAPQRYPTGTLITVQTVSAREAEPWTFRVDAAEMLPLPIGPLNAIRLTRLPRQPYDQQVDLWFAPTMGYLPVRLRVTHPNGDVADQVLRKFDPS